MEYQKIDLKNTYNKLSSLPRHQARAFFKYFLTIRQSRVDMLSSALLSTNNKFKLDFSEESIKNLNQWYKDVYKKERKKPEDMERSRESLNTKVHPLLDTTWDEVISVPKDTASEDSFSYAIDIYIYIGEIIIRNYPEKKWVLCTRSKNYIHYHQPVINLTEKGSTFSPISFGLSDADWLANNEWDLNLMEIYTSLKEKIERT